MPDCSPLLVNMSAAAPPTPNYVDPQLHGHVWLITSCIFLPIATFFVFARLWARIVVLRSPGIDDVLIVPALVSPLRTAPIRNVLTLQPSFVGGVPSSGPISVRLLNAPSST